MAKKFITLCVIQLISIRVQAFERMNGILGKIQEQVENTATYFVQKFTDSFYVFEEKDPPLVDSNAKAKEIQQSSDHFFGFVGDHFQEYVAVPIMTKTMRTIFKTVKKMIQTTVDNIQIDNQKAQDRGDQYESILKYYSN